MGMAYRGHGGLGVGFHGEPGLEFRAFPRSGPYYRSLSLPVQRASISETALPREPNTCPSVVLDSGDVNEWNEMALPKSTSRLSNYSEPIGKHRFNLKVFVSPLPFLPIRSPSLPGSTAELFPFRTSGRCNYLKGSMTAVQKTPGPLNLPTTVARPLRPALLVARP